MTRNLPQLSPAMAVQALAMATAIGCMSAAMAVAQEPAGLAQMRDHALELVNQDRSENGLPALDAGPNLDTAAIAHAEDMLARDYYDHVSPEGESVADRYRAAGGSEWELVAENISRCMGCTAGLDVVQELQEGWMNSPEHRANILANGLDRFGFGLASDGSTLYAVQTFAGPGTPRGNAADAEISVVAPQDQTAVLLQQINAAREQAGVPALTPSTELGSAARQLLPEPGSRFDLDAMGDLTAALPAQEQVRWKQLFTASGACGGCGIQATEADIASFADDWLDNPTYRERFVSASFSHIGFALAADGEGKKIAVAMLGAAR